MRSTAPLLTALALALAGCGLAVGPAPSAVQLLVTRDFGNRVLARSGDLDHGEGETVLSLLARNVPVRTGPGGRAVESIDGAASGGQGADAQSWSYYVNGVRASKGPARTPVHAGDHIWWDLHSASQVADAPAVVGAFPEPFLNGTGGHRLPVRIECATASTAACNTVTAALRGLGVPAAIAAIGSGGAPETLRVMVGPWDGLEGLEAQLLADGPRTSGVYARFSSAGRVLTLLGQDGAPVRTLHAGAGLIAATQEPKEAPVWVISGTDEAGVELAARAFDRSTLSDRFAVALAPGGPIALPASGSGGV